MEHPAVLAVNPPRSPLQMSVTFPPSLFMDHKCIVLNWPMMTTIVVLWSMTDFIHFIHILLQFRLAYVAPESRVMGAGDLVDDPKKIARHYLLGSFIIDLFVVLPLPQSLRHISQIAQETNGEIQCSVGRQPVVLRALSQRLCRAFKYAVNGIVDDGWSIMDSDGADDVTGWSIMDSDGADDVTIAINSSPGKFLGSQSNTLSILPTFGVFFAPGLQCFFRRATASQVLVLLALQMQELFTTPHFITTPHFRSTCSWCHKHDWS